MAIKRIYSGVCRRIQTPPKVINARERSSMERIPSTSCPVPRSRIVIQKRYCSKSVNKVYELASAVEQMDKQVEQLSSQGDYAAASDAMASALEVIAPDEKNPAVTLSVFSSLARLAALYMMQCRFSDAKKILLRLFSALSLHRTNVEAKLAKVTADQNEEGISSMKEELERVEKTLTFLASDLGKAYEELADYEEAQRYHKYAFEKAQLDNVEIYAGSFAGNLAMLYERLGNLKESEKYHIISLTLNDMIERRDHPHFATSLHFLHHEHKISAVQWRRTVANVMNQSRDSSNQIDIDSIMPDDLDAKTEDESSSEASKTLGKDEVLVIDEEAPRNTAVSTMTNEEKAEAHYRHHQRAHMDGEIQLANTLLQNQQLNVGENKLPLIPQMIYAATVQRNLEQYDQAKATFDAIGEIYAAQSDSLAKSAGKATLQMHYGLLESARSDWTAAVSHFRNAFAIRSAVLGLDHIHTAISAYEIGFALIQSQDADVVADAKYYLNSAFEAFQKSLPASHSINNLTRGAQSQVQDSEREKFAAESLLKSAAHQYL